MANFLDLNKDGKVDEQDAYLALEQAEKFYAVVESKIPLYRPQINIALGFGTLFYSRSFSYTILFSQSFRITGWPVVKDGYEKLVIQYKAAREEVHRQAPSLSEARTIVANYREEMQALQEAYKAANESGDVSSASSVQRQIDALHSQYRAAMGVLSSLQAIIAAVDPYKVGEIAAGMWAGVSACIATAVSPSAQCLASGVHLGEKAGALAVALWQRVGARPGAPRDANRDKWARFYLEAACKAMGVAAAFYMQRVVNAYQGCVLGASVLVDAVDELCAAQSSRMPAEAKATAQLALSAVGFAWQYKTPGSGQPPGLLSPLLFAPLALERLLAAFASQKMWETAW